MAKLEGKGRLHSMASTALALTCSATLDGYEAVSETVRWEASSPAQMPVVLTLTPVIDAEEVLEEAEEAAAAEAAEARRAREATQRAAAQRATTQRRSARRAPTRRAPSEEPRRTTSGASLQLPRVTHARAPPPSRPSARARASDPRRLPRRPHLRHPRLPRSRSERVRSACRRSPTLRST